MAIEYQVIYSVQTSIHLLIHAYDDEGEIPPVKEERLLGIVRDRWFDSFQNAIEDEQYGLGLPSDHEITRELWNRQHNAHAELLKRVKAQMEPEDGQA